MPLSDTTIRSAKPGAKPRKLADEKGLLLVQPSGGKLWRLQYRAAGKEKKLSLGTYPEVPLKEARQRGTKRAPNSLPASILARRARPAQRRQLKPPRTPLRS